MTQTVQVLKNGNPKCEHCFQRCEHLWCSNMLVFYYCTACFLHFCIAVGEKQLTKDEIANLCVAPTGVETLMGAANEH